MEKVPQLLVEALAERALIKPEAQGEPTAMVALAETALLPKSVVAAAAAGERTAAAVAADRTRFPPAPPTKPFPVVAAVVPARQHPLARPAR